MVVDASALVAIIQEEEGFEELVMKLGSSDVWLTSASSYLEASMALIGRRWKDAELQLDQMLIESQVVVVPVDEAQVRIARHAFRAFGKGRHPAGLNFGDCMTYALAKQTAQPLLFVGRDFPQTDLLLA